MAGKPSGRSGLQLLTLRLALWGAVLIAGLSATWLFLAPAQPGTPLGQGPYRLETTTGQPFTAASLTGQPALVFFGFTHCPDVCPTTLADIALWQDTLGPLAQGLRVWLITVDPERDTVATLRDYLSWLPGVVGVTGSPAETDKALTAFRGFARKVPLGNGDYGMDHSAGVMLFDASGRYLRSFAYQADPAEVTASLRPVLEATR